MAPVPRVLLFAAVLLVCARATAWSCGECSDAVSYLQQEWANAEPIFLEDLPEAVCRGSPAPWCAGLVRGSIEAISSVLSGLDARELCAELGLCNATTTTAALSLHA
jgi:hypothetical protein